MSAEPTAAAQVGSSTTQARASSPGAFAALRERVMRGETWVLALSALYFLALLPIVPDLANPENLQNVLSNMLPLLAVALGQTFVLITGGIDLSVTSVIALASVGGAWVMTSGVGASGPAVAIPAGIVTMLAIGAAMGLLNGLAITRLAMPAFMVTLSTMLFGSGFAIWATKSKGIYDLPDGFNEIAQGTLGFLPVAIIPIAIVAVITHFVLARSAYGRRLIAVGLNVKAARVSGVPVARVTVLAYVSSGLLGAIGAVLYTGRLETGSPVLGQRLFLDVIGAAVIGGTSLFGGKGSVAGTLYGVLFITLIDNSLNLLGLSNFSVLMAKGTVILLAALFDTIRSRAGNRG